jgi:hypothetical protein
MHRMYLRTSLAVVACKTAVFAVKLLVSHRWQLQRFGPGPLTSGMLAVGTTVQRSVIATGS